MHQFSHYHLIQSAIAPVTKIFTNTNGSNTFHPVSINWSYRGRGSDARSSIKKRMKANVFRKNHTHGGRNAGPSQPPKNKVTVIAEMSVMPKYSPIKNIPNFIPEYSE